MSIKSPQVYQNPANLANQEWYANLVEECKATITEAVFTSRYALVEGYWQVGKLIREVYKTRKELYGKKIAQDLAESIGISERTINYACAAYEKYPDIGSMPEGKNISWNKLITKYLPEFTDDEKKHLEHKQIPDDLKLVNEDFRTYDIADSSIDAIVTDPPYPQEFLPLWDDLAQFAEKKLKPSGFLITYSGQYHLPYIYDTFSNKLMYFWTFAIYLPGSTMLVNNIGVMNAWKPILVYQKPPFKKMEYTAYDMVVSPNPEKALHEWQQSEGGVKKLIEWFTNEGDLVVDPFSGAGTFAKVAFEMKRKAIGIEIDENTHLRAKNRI